MKKKSSFILFATICCAVLICAQTAMARSGCCSHHGGVCGCGCCDGTGLSDTCAPYYPSCNSSNTSFSTTSTSTTSSTSTTEQKTCPTNSTGTYPNCKCNNGYVLTPSKTKCYELPENSHAANNGEDLWLCDEGYEEDGDSCVVSKTKTEEIKESNEDDKSNDENTGDENTEEAKEVSETDDNKDEKIKTLESEISNLKNIVSEKEELEKQNNELKSELNSIKKERSDESDDDFGSFFGWVTTVLIGSWIYKNKIKK